MCLQSLSNRIGRLSLQSITWFTWCILIAHAKDEASFYDIHINKMEEGDDTSTYDAVEEVEMNDGTITIILFHEYY